MLLDNCSGSWHDPRNVCWSRRADVLGLIDRNAELRWEFPVLNLPSNSLYHKTVARVQGYALFASFKIAIFNNFKEYAII